MAIVLGCIPGIYKFQTDTSAVHKKDVRMGLQVTDKDSKHPTKGNIAPNPIPY